MPSWVSLLFLDPMFSYFPDSLFALLEYIFKLPAYMKDTAGSVPDQCNKISITSKRVTQIFDFPVHIKTMFTLYCSLLRVQQH